jgi:hypothetical protein
MGQIVRASSAQAEMTLLAWKWRSRSIGRPSFAAHGAELDEAHVTELRLADTEIAEAEGEAVGIELREEPGALRIGRKQFDDGPEAECALVGIYGGALCAAVGEELFDLCLSDEFH